MPFASSVVAVIALACILGTLIPQGGDVARLLQKNPGAKGQMELLEFLGLTHVYTSAWFIGLLGLLSASLAVCSYKRFRAAMNSRGRPRGRAFGSLITHISMLLILAGGVIRGTWGDRGELPLHEGQTSDRFMVNGSEKKLPFSIHLSNFEVETYSPDTAGNAKPQMGAQRLLADFPAKGLQWTLPVTIGFEKTLAVDKKAPGAENTYHVKILRQVQDFVIDMATREVTDRSDEPRNPALQVEIVHNAATNTQWLFALHPDFDMHGTDEGADKLQLRYQVELQMPRKPGIKDFKSTLQVLEGSTVVKEKTIEVNSPLSYKGYTFYQSGYNPQDPTWTSLQVVRDPGVPLVYTGFLLMILGLTAVFYMYPQRLGQRNPSSGPDAATKELDNE